MLTREDLRNYQHTIIGKIEQCAHPDPKQKLPGLVIALEPGAGKTAAVLTALKDMIDTGRVRRALIVAPLLVAQTTWPDEFEDWSHLSGTPITLIRVEDDDPGLAAVGAAAFKRAKVAYKRRFASLVDREQRDRGCDRADAIATVIATWEARHEATFTLLEKSRGKQPNAEVSAIATRYKDAAVAAEKERRLRELARSSTPFHIINKEALPWLWEYSLERRRWPYDVLVADDLRESRTGKRRTPKSITRWGVLARARSHLKFTLQLTGTPTPKGLVNMWGLLYPIDLGHRLGATKTAFKQRWFDVDRERFKEDPKPFAYDEIMSRAKDVMFALSDEDSPDLPPYVPDPIRVRLPEKVLAAYRKFKREMVSEDYGVEAVNAGVLHGKLFQFANGSMYREDREDVPIHDLKIEALRGLVDRLDGEPLLIAYTYEFDKQRILKEFPETVVLRPENAVEVKRRWNRGEISMLLAHRASAGHGLNLQQGGHHMCEYGLTSDWELYEQFRKRLLRPGQTKTVYNHIIIAEGTIDEEAYPMYLTPKHNEQHRILDYVRLPSSSRPALGLRELMLLSSI
jgi:hypothetical protein